MSINNDNNTLKIQIIDWYSEDKIIENSSEESSDDDNSSNDFKRKIQEDKSKFLVYIFGRDLSEKTYCIRVTDFTPYFYIRLPDECNSRHAKILEKYVRNKMWGKYKNCLLRSTFHKKHKFRNFDNFKKHNFVRLVFSNKRAMHSAVSIFQNKNYNPETNITKRTPKKLTIFSIKKSPFCYELFENNIDPMIKLIHHKNINPVGWIEIENYENIYDNNSTTNFSYTTRWSNLKKINEEKNSKSRIMAYDIECDSSHGDFPLPIKDYTKISREIFNIFLKLNKDKSELSSDYGKSKKNKVKIKEIVDILENRKKFIKDCINKAFNNDFENDFEISSVFTKNNRKPRANEIDLASVKASEILILSKNPNSIERKRHNTHVINKITKILDGLLPPIKGDQTIQIGMSFIKYGTDKPYKNYMLTLKGCTKLKNAKTYCFEKEVDLLSKFRNIILKEDPDIITGWNTDGFDTPWLFKRASELGLDNFNFLGRFDDYCSEIKTKQIKGPTGQLIKKDYVNLPGRIQMDMYPLVQKSYNLNSYKLDNVSANFINGKIKNLEYDSKNNITTIDTNDTKGLNIGDFIVFKEVDGYLENKYMDGKKYSIIEKDNNTLKIKDNIKLNLNKTCTWCLGKDDVSPKDIFHLQNGTDSDRYIIAKYCMMDVILCIELLNKLQLHTNCIGQSEVCLIPLSWIISRGQGVKILSLVSAFLKKENYLLPYLYKDTFDSEGFEGAVVLNPKPGIYIDTPIAVLDYGSLYPSSMIECNISHDTIVKDEKYLGDIGKELLEDMGYGVEDLSYDIFKTIYRPSGAVKGKEKVGVKTVRFVQYPDGQKGLIPKILMHLLTARKTARIKIKYKTVTVLENAVEKKYIGLYNKENKIIINDKKEKINLNGKEILSITPTYSPFECSIFDGRQLAFKVVANSVYGSLGAKTSDIYYKELAASTTAVGRERLIIAQKYSEDSKNYPQKLNNGKTIYLQHDVIYGDTDSIFVKFKCIDNDGNPLTGREARQRSIDLAIQTEKGIQSKILREPQVLEYEKTFDPFILCGKKRYVGNLYEMSPDKFKLKSMGIVLKRRDNANIVKIIYGGIVDIIMKEKDIKPSIDFLRKSLVKLIKGKYDLDTLVVTKTLSSYYKDPDRIAHKVLADRMGERDPGNKPQVNDRIPFLYVDLPKNRNKKKVLQGERIEHPDYVKENKLQPDYEHYITNQILKPVTQIFGLSLEQIPGYSGDITEYDRMYNTFIKDGHSINESIRRVLEKKRKVAEKILFSDILRRLENKRMRNNEITKYFSI
jgi:DNA polymerase elongation subunit (family B)